MQRSAELCDRPLDEAVFAGTHNAMSSSDNGFFSANQDLDITGQLGLGVRALLIDVWHWDTQSQLSELLQSQTLPATYVDYLRASSARVTRRGRARGGVTASAGSARGPPTRVSARSASSSTRTRTK